MVEDYFDALSVRSYELACERTAPSFERELTAYVRRRGAPEASGCPRILELIGSGNDPRVVEYQREVEVGTVEVQGDRATARLSGEGRQVARLVRSGDEWLIEDLDFGGAQTGR